MLTIDELVKQMIATSPFLAIMIYFLNRVYEDGKADRAEAAKERKATIWLLSEMKNAISNLEEKLTGERTPTLHQRPPELDAVIARATSTDDRAH